MLLRGCQHPKHMRLAAATIGYAAPWKLDRTYIGVNLALAAAGYNLALQFVG
jgi:hypothetical protein